MKKLLVTTLLALGAVSVANAEVYKITKFTKAQEREVEAYFSEGSGDQAAFPTNKGILWVYIESPAMNVLNNAKAGECYNVTGQNDFLTMKAKKVSCSNNTSKKMTQKQIDACVMKWVDAYRKEAGEEVLVRQDMLDEWESWCKAGKRP